MKVPFSTGTDWFVYDFSRVYVPRKKEGETVEELLPGDWLKQLEAGRSTITNGPALGFYVGRGEAKFECGDTLKMEKAAEVRIDGAGIGRHDFRSIEVVYNGRVVATAKTSRNGGHYQAIIQEPITLDRSGWLALRIPDQGQPKNELGQPLFAHTSPIYVELEGRKVFDRPTAEVLLAEMRRGLEVIPKRGTFAEDAELQRVLAVYREGIATLENRMAEEAAKPKE